MIITAVIGTLVFSILACQLDLGGPPAPSEPATPTVESSESLEDEWEQTFSGDLSAGRIEIVLDEAQLTSFVIERLAAKEEQVITDPQVMLQDGQITILGNVEPGLVTARIRIIIEPIIQSDGSIEFMVKSIDLGPIPAPEALTNSLSAFITESLTGTVGSLATGFRVTSITIADGEVSIVGELR